MAEVRVTEPSFPACSNPQGQTKAFYSSGTHGIPGDTTTYTGSDSVYWLTSDTLTQCFCAEDESGIQTNWWKVSSLNFDEVEYLKNLGWIYVPNGSEWGLEEAPYMAINQKYSCGNEKEDDGKVSDRDKDRSVRNRGGRGGITGEVLGASTYTGQVLGLATTGGKYIAVLFLIIGGLSFAVSAFFLKSGSEN